MRRSVRCAVALVILAAACSAKAIAQVPAPLDRPVGLDFFGKPLVVKKLTALEIGALGAAAGVPMGFEAAVPGESSPVNVAASGKPLRSVLDRVVGRKATGEPLVLHGAHDVPELARAARVAMGLELLPAGGQPAGSDGVKVTGLSLGDALTALMALDPRYEWREFDGVVVVRPLLAWTQPDHPLSRDTGPARLENATVIDAVNYLQALLEPGLRFTAGRDRAVEAPRITVSTAGGTLLPLLNAIARSFGELCWTYEELTERDTQFFGGRNHQIGLRLPTGEGQGFAFR